MTAVCASEHRAVEQSAPHLALTARLGTEEYGIDILAVQEIRPFESPTHIANAGSHLRGVMDLRGVIVPVIDLRRLLALPAETGNDTVTIVVTVEGRVFGLVVDSVSDVAALDPARIQPRPSLRSGRDTDFIVGLARLDTADGQRLLLLMDLAALLRDL
jgi:purine-binding chemotaxis protein CheW